MRVQIRLASRKGDFDIVIIHLGNFIEIRRHVFGCEIDEVIGGGAALNITIGAFDVAKRTRIKPKGLEFFKKDRGPPLTFGSGGRVLEFTRVNKCVHVSLLAGILLTVTHNYVSNIS